MQIIDSPAEMTLWSREICRQGFTIALVPTMGYFHAGHLALMERAGQLADKKVVSLFVNPKQFGPNEDLDRYPRNLHRDMELARSREVDVLFAPESNAMYRPESSTTVHVSGVSEGFCGLQRPGHFDGVATVVTKLFNIVQPRYAVFGEKDWQQLAVIQRMTADLNMPVEIVSHPTVREEDGLAMSSRNTYMSPAERRQADCLYQSILLARQLVAAGETDPVPVEQAVKKRLSSCSVATVEYASIVNGQDLTAVSHIDHNTVLLLAVRIGTTRLIDNGRLLD